MCREEEKSLSQQGLFIILRVTSPVNTLIKCNHSQEEKGERVDFYKGISLIKLRKHFRHGDQLQIIRNRLDSLQIVRIFFSGVLFEW